MKTFAKIFSVFLNLANAAAGIAVVIILIFKMDFISVFYINSMSSNESLFFNLLLFQTGLVLAGIVLCLLISEYDKRDITVEFPVIYEALPLIIGGICCYYAFGGDTVREKVIVAASALLYILLSAVIIYTGARVFQMYPKEK